MAAGTTGTMTGPRVRRAPGEPAAATVETDAPALLDALRLETGALPEPETDTEIDHYLRRSYALVDRLRQALTTTDSGDA